MAQDWVRSDFATAMGDTRGPLRAKSLHVSNESTFRQRHTGAVADDDVIQQANVHQSERLLLWQGGHNAKEKAEMAVFPRVSCIPLNIIYRGR
jgi:hypothetical protein